MILRRMLRLSVRCRPDDGAMHALAGKYFVLLMPARHDFGLFPYVMSGRHKKYCRGDRDNAPDSRRQPRYVAFDDAAVECSG